VTSRWAGDTSVTGSEAQETGAALGGAQGSGRFELGAGRGTLTASNPSSGTQGANILINDAGEVRMGECGWREWVGGGMRGAEGTETLHLSLCLQLTSGSQPKLGRRWLGASLSLEHPTGEGCPAGSCGWGGGGFSHPGSLGTPSSMEDSFPLLGSLKFSVLFVLISLSFLFTCVCVVLGLELRPYILSHSASPLL
jgi:hypothetical protein